MVDFILKKLYNANTTRHKNGGFFIGKTYHHSDGSYSTTSGNTIHHSNGGYSTVNGNTIHHSDGSYSTVNGNTIHHSNGGYSTVSGNTIHHSNGGYSTGNDSGCYLTTACVEARSLPDDCDELTTLRNFRDGYMKSQPEGEADIKTYYRVAPKIIEAINARADAKRIYNDMYEHMIVPCVEMIKNGRLAEAYSFYKSTALELAEAYL